MKTYLGIVDALGLESFIKYDEKQEQKMERELKFLKLRAQLNPQRNTVVYKIELPDIEIEKIKILLKEGQFVKAGQIVTRYLDSANGTKLTEKNKHLQVVRRIKGYL